MLVGTEILAALEWEVRAKGLERRGVEAACLAPLIGVVRSPLEAS
jgi:hypothetical protein